ncbi:hypothetical protein U1Q18_004406 [Sarracenia purpurea var. burkii]
MGHHCCSKHKVKRGLRSPEEDDKLIKYITSHGHGCWSSVPKLAEEYQNPNFASRSLMEMEALVQSSSLNISSGFEILQENYMWGSTGLEPSERARREVIAQLQQQQQPDQEEKGCKGEEIHKVNYEYSIML